MKNMELWTDRTGIQFFYIPNYQEKRPLKIWKLSQYFFSRHIVQSTVNCYSMEDCVDIVDNEQNSFTRRKSFSGQVFIIKQTNLIEYINWF